MIAELNQLLINAHHADDVNEVNCHELVTLINRVILELLNLIKHYLLYR